MLLPFTSLQNTAMAGQIAPQGQLVASEQRSACDDEILFAAHSPEAERAVRAAGLIGFNRTAGRANGDAVGIGPTDHLERGFGYPSVMRNT